MSEIDYEEDTAVSNETLSEISQLAHKQVEAQRTYDALVIETKKAKQELWGIQERDLPEAMLAAGMTAFTIDSGESITVKEDLMASISQKNKPAAVAWLIGNGHGSLVKEDVVVPFEKGDTEAVHILSKLLEANGVSNYNVIEAVHTGSVKSLIKELLAEGKDVPLELFGGHFVKKAIVK